MKYYVAYGSNLSVDQMAHRCPDATIVGTGVLKDWELVFRVHATIEPRPGCTVPVLVWAISERDEARLDRYEGYPRYYVKKYLSVPVQAPMGRLNVRGMVSRCTGITARRAHGTVFRGRNTTSGC